MRGLKVGQQLMVWCAEPEPGWHQGTVSRLKHRCTVNDNVFCKFEDGEHGAFLTEENCGSIWVLLKEPADEQAADQQPADQQPADQQPAD